MKCFNCGKEIEDNSFFCPECGISILQINRTESFLIIINDELNPASRITAKICLKEVAHHTGTYMINTTIHPNDEIIFQLKECESGPNKGLYMIQELL